MNIRECYIRMMNYLERDFNLEKYKIEKYMVIK